MRGSTPAPGIEFAEVGGNTSCVAIPAAGGRWLVLDAGTGLGRLAGALNGAPLRATIVLTHLHWDHTHGLPFLPSADRPDAEIEVLLPAQGQDALAVMARAMSPPHFPIQPDELEGSWRYRSLEPGRWQIEGFTVTAAEIHHKGGRTFGYRVDDGGTSLAYLPDHSPHQATPERRAAASDLVRGVDVLLHGGGYLASERETADDYGHATVDDALEIAADGAVGRLVLIHHAPRRTDADVAAIERDLAATRRPFTVTIGREGDWIDTR
jgi:ribonuclease BN (tRNA processing enzyme)